MLACDKTVTLVRCDGEEYTNTVIKGVSWFDKCQVALKDKGMVAGNTVKVRIPLAAIPKDIQPQPDDILILGEITAPILKPADFTAYRHAKVVGVGDNRRGGLPHLAVTCG